MTNLHGAQFATLPAAVKAIKEDASLHKHETQVDRAFKRDDAKRLICRHRNQHECTWNVEVVKDMSALGTWTIVSVDSAHSESCENARNVDESKRHASGSTNGAGDSHPRATVGLDAPNHQLFQGSFGRRDLVLTQDMRWGSAKEASRAVNDFALFAQKKRARMDKKTSGGRNKKYICSCDNCGWYVRVLRAPKAESWKISSMNLQHSETCVGAAQPTARQLADMASFRQAVVTHSKANGKLLTEDFLSSAEQGIKIPLRLAYRAKKLIAVHSQDDLVESYKFIPSLLSSFVDKNSPSIADYTASDMGHFVRAFVLPSVSHHAAPALQKIVGVEVIPCTCPDYKGYVVLLLGQDGNFQPQIIAFGLVPEPSAENVEWFITRAQRGFSFDEVPVVCTFLYPGVVDGVRRALPTVTIRFCIKSLVEALNQDKSVAKLGPAELLVWELHFQETEAGVGMHGATTTDGCDEAPFDLLYSYLTRMMELTFAKSTLAGQLLAASTILTPGAQHVYSDEVNESLQYTTRPSDDMLAYVWKSGARPKANFRVHLGDGTCTCSSMYQLGIPCRHFIAAARHFGQDQLILNHFGSIYKADTYVAAFHKARIEMPLESDLSKDESLLPAAAVVDGRTSSSKARKAKAPDLNSRKDKVAKASPMPIPPSTTTTSAPSTLVLSSDSATNTTDMDMISAMSMGLAIPGLTPPMMQQYPIPPHSYLHEMHMHMTHHQQHQQQTNPPPSSAPNGFSMV
ncbi:hypothetical protein DYB34_003086 [Aphanomyces astaci]|uniref:SWIM-type domain-containing protein n=1 Tax=Aphanomyces astaci TaxID=112090 RepID=A0A3R6Z758_APHAT|nr:hypothetical protein DYB34_003086 [Aphanomyces astaci]